MFAGKSGVYPNHRHLRNIDCLMARTAGLVCFISTVAAAKKERKEAYYERCQ